VRVASGKQLPTVLWDVVSGDAGGHVPPERMVAKVSREVRPGSIVIFHINGRGPNTRKALPAIIKELRAKGMRFVFVSELLQLVRAGDAKVIPARFDIRIPPKEERARPAG
jgi:peptidoglycan/xylan/chitin deacetylase (PgdA/CDA1 family)